MMFHTIEIHKELNKQLMDTTFAGVELPFETMTPPQIKLFYHSTGLNHIYDLVEEHFKKISQSYVFEYTLNCTTLDTFSQKLLSFVLLRTDSDVFRESVFSYYISIIKSLYPDTYEGQTGGWFYNPEFFILPEKDNLFLISPDPTSESCDTLKDVSTGFQKVEGVANSVYIFNATYNRNFKDILDWSQSFFKRQYDSSLNIVNDLQIKLQQYCQYLRHYIKDTDKNAVEYYYLTFPLIASRNWQLPSIYREIFGDDTLFDSNGQLKRFQGHGHFAIYFETCEKVDAITKKEDTFRKLSLEINNLIQCSGLNYNFNMGLQAQTRLEKSLTRNALTQIMSRNMSHNVGSHVMSRASRLAPGHEDLKHMPTLAAFTQELMDFIAQISTEWPAWTHAACISQDVFAWLFKQKLLLKNIAASEGLHEFRFEKADNGKLACYKPLKDKDGNQLKDENGNDQYGYQVDKTIRFFVRKYKAEKGVPEGMKRGLHEKDGSKCTTLFPNCQTEGCYTIDAKALINFAPKDGDINQVLSSECLPIAFPGGRVGQQAFYTLLLGFIRNSAKHGHAAKKSNHKGNSNLNVYMDIIDDPTCVIEYPEHHKEGEPVPTKSAYKIRLYSNSETKNDGTLDAFIVKQNQNLAESVIDEQGQTRKQNWGLMELRIAAGYLQQLSMDTIGDGAAEVFVEYKDEKDQKVFKLTLETDKEKKEAEESKVKKKLEDRIVHYWKDEPGMFLAKPLGRGENDGTKNGLTVGHYDATQCQVKPGRFFLEFKMLRPQIIGMILGPELCGKVENDEAAGWYKHDKDEQGNRQYEYCVLDPAVSAFGADLLKFLKQESCEHNKTELSDEDYLLDKIDCYPTRLFLLVDGDHGINDAKSEKNPNGHESILRKRVCILTKEKFQEIIKDKKADAVALELQQTWVRHIAVQIRGFDPNGRLEIYTTIFDEKGDSQASKEKQNTSGVEYANKAESCFQRHRDDAELEQLAQDLKTAIEERTPNTSPQSFFEKGTTERKDRWGVDGLCLNGDPTEKKFKSISSEPDKTTYSLLFGRHFALYRGNFDLYDKNVELVTNKTPVYAESISGVSTLFGMVQGAMDDLSKTERPDGILRLRWQLVESALMRTVLVDERIQESFADVTESEAMKYLAQQRVHIGYWENPERYEQNFPQYGDKEVPLRDCGYVVLKSNKEGISISLHRDRKKRTRKEIDGKMQTVFEKSDTDYAPKEQNASLIWPPANQVWDNVIPDEESGKQGFDFLVIHQGILDKWCDKLENGNIDKKETKKLTLDALVTKLKKKFPFVTITSGRGRPADIPSNVRFIAISAIQCTAHGGWYDKFSLVNQIFSLTEKEEKG